MTDLQDALAAKVEVWRKDNLIEKALSGHERGARAAAKREAADGVEELPQEHTNE